MQVSFTMWNPIIWTQEEDLERKGCLYLVYIAFMLHIFFISWLKLQGLLAISLCQPVCANSSSWLHNILWCRCTIFYSFFYQWAFTLFPVFWGCKQSCDKYSCVYIQDFTSPNKISFPISKQNFISHFIQSALPHTGSSVNLVIHGKCCCGGHTLNISGRLCICFLSTGLQRIQRWVFCETSRLPPCREPSRFSGTWNCSQGMSVPMSGWALGIGVPSPQTLPSLVTC